MVATTTLFDHELNKPTGDDEIDRLLQEARQASGKDWQAIATWHRDKRLLSKDRAFQTWQLCVYVGGCLPWQVIMCASDRGTVFAYLAGYVSGLAQHPGSGHARAGGEK